MPRALLPRPSGAGLFVLGGNTTHLTLVRSSRCEWKKPTNEQTDGQFVIIAAFDHTGTQLPVEERVALALKRCGMSVTCERRACFFSRCWYLLLLSFVAFLAL